MKRFVASAAVALAVAACAAASPDAARLIPRFALTVATLPIALCQRLSATPLPLLVAAGVALGVLPVIAIASALLQLRRTGRVLRRIDRGWSEVMSERVQLLAERLGFAGYVRVAQSDAVFAFTHGLVWPRVIMSHGLVATLDDEELEAVLRHEMGHARRRDPLRILIARSLTRAATAVPGAPGTLETYLCRLELAADREVVTAMGDVLPLASALQRTLDEPAMPEIASAAVSGLSATDVRIDHLLGVSTSPRLLGRGVNRVHAALFWLAMAASLCLLIASAPSLSSILTCIGC